MLPSHIHMCRSMTSTASPLPTHFYPAASLHSRLYSSGTRPQLPVRVCCHVQWMHWHYGLANMPLSCLACWAGVCSLFTFSSVTCTLFNCLLLSFIAGVNISGDLKNPSVSIPLGTLLACGITFVVYIVLCELVDSRVYMCYMLQTNFFFSHFQCFYMHKRSAPVQL